MDSQEIEFLYRYISAEGNPASLDKKPGVVAPDGVVLDGAELTLDAIARTEARDNWLTLVLQSGQVPDEFLKLVTNVRGLTFEVSQANATTLKRTLDRSLSLYRAKWSKFALEEIGEGDKFRCLVCPECESTLDVSGLPNSEFVFCPYCESLAKHNGELLPSGTNYRCCDQCGWFDRVQRHTEFYFYFLISIYGLSSKRRYLCDICAIRLFWKVLAANLFFLIGIPPALWMLNKSLRGRHEGLEALAAANRLGKKGQLQDALQFYAICLNHHPGHPGLYYDQALAALAIDDRSTARDFLDQSLSTCSNYTPAHSLIEQLNERET